MTQPSSRRRLSFAIVFATLSVALANVAVHAGSTVAGMLIGWVAVDAFMLSVAYFVNWPGVFGKTVAGKLKWSNALVMAPFLLFIRIVWQFQNVVFRTPIFSEVVPDLFVGRLCARGLLPNDISVVVDFTAEFQLPRSVRDKIQTICIPTLDGTAPNWRECQRAFELIGTGHRRIYVWCANGHGRSVTFVAAWLGKQGVCKTSKEALKLIHDARPSAAPNRDQISSLAFAFESIIGTHTLPESN